jgi:hypothetical protein
MSTCAWSSAGTSELQAQLGECHGFRVDGPGGRIGFVEDVLSEDDDSPPSVLLLRIGWLGRRQLAIESGEVIAVLPREGRIVLAEQPAVAGPDLVDRLRPFRRAFELASP